jgi:site-specific DNA-methyltransferase (adenine-specific)
MERSLLEEGNDSFIRFNEAIPILKKVRALREQTFDKYVSARRPFGFTTDFKEFKEAPFKDGIKIYANKQTGYIKRTEIKQNIEWVDKYKVFITKGYGAGEDFPHQIINKPILGAPGTCCTETYLLVGPFISKKITLNVVSYIQTKFFRFLVLLNKITQDATSKVYDFVPIQNFEESWTDEKLYKKYGLIKSEAAFINLMIRPMELDND